jgi:ketopantoate reductase
MTTKNIRKHVCWRWCHRRLDRHRTGPCRLLEVSVVARGDALAHIRATGLRLQTVAGVHQAASVRSSDDPAALGVQDLVVIAVKAPALLTWRAASLP